MTTTAHHARRVYAGATRKPAHRALPERMSRRHPVSWLDCPADEFLDLLRQHEAGEIDLLAMPVDVEIEDEYHMEPRNENENV